MRYGEPLFWRRAAFLLMVAVGLCLTRPGFAQSVSAPARGTERRVALVIGNATYQSLPLLANAANDARLVAGTLKDLGFVLVGDAAQVDLGKPAFDAAVRGFGQALQDADVGVFYYAGHGLQVQGTNWLVPVGANPVGPQDLDFQMVDADLVLKQMQYARTRLNVMILDACRNNPFNGRGLRAATGGLAEMRAPEGTLIAYATQPGAVAHDGIGANSPFSAALARTMRQPGLDVFRLFNEVGLSVKRETGGDQQPWMSSSPIDGEFYFSRIRPSGVPAAPDPDLAFWQSIPSSADPAEYQAYLQQFPNGRFAALARERSSPRMAQPTAPVPQALLALLHPQGLRTESTRSISLFSASANAVNEVSRAAESSYLDYVTIFNPERGPAADRQPGRPFGKVADFSLRALDQLKRSLAGDPVSGSDEPAFIEVHEPSHMIRLPPHDDIDAVASTDGLRPLAQRFLDSGEALIAVTEVARAYYNQGDYRDDGFAQGRAMHPRLMAAYRDFLAVSAALRKLLTNLSPEMRETYMRGLSPDLQASEAAKLHHLLQARNLVAFIAATLDNGADVRKISVPGLKARIDLVEQSFAEAQRARVTQPDNDFYAECNLKFLEVAKTLWRSLRDRQPIDSFKFSFRTEQENDIVSRFNALLDASVRER